VSDTPDIYVPKEWRKRAENVKQGSSDELVESPYNTWIADEMRRQVAYYSEMIDQGICPEQARMVLPQSMYTEFIETGSLAAYARLAKLRLDPHAQKEVRLYAEAVDDILSKLFPVSWEALRG
jgi:thymidylate synthase (FAD)